MPPASGKNNFLLKRNSSAGEGTPASVSVNMAATKANRAYYRMIPYRSSPSSPNSLSFFRATPGSASAI